MLNVYRFVLIYVESYWFDLIWFDNAWILFSQRIDGQNLFKGDHESWFSAPAWHFSMSADNACSKILQAKR